MMKLEIFRGAAALLVLLMGAAGARAQDSGEVPRRSDSAEVARRLSSRNAVERREAAEALAQTAAVEHRRLVDGYRVQEKDSKVKLALDWALYRMGRGGSLFPLVDALDDKKLAEQSVGYLKQLETPAALYVFLDKVNGQTTVRLLEVLAHLGDSETLERVKPFTSALDPNISEAAKFAEREITIRLEETPAVEPKRERKVGQSAETEPE